jgi:hypothetical protein
MASYCLAQAPSRSTGRMTYRIEPLQQFNRDARLLVLDQTLVECQSARNVLAGDRHS